MAGYIEDRWFKKGPDGKRTVPTDRHGQGKRYKVAGIPGVRSRSFPDKQLAAARAWLAKAQADAAKGEFVDPRDGNITLREYVDSFWRPARSADPATLEVSDRRVRNQILPYLGGLPLRQIKVDSLRLWLKSLEGVVGDGTKVGAWGYLNNILDCAVDDERITKNPCRATTIKPPAKPPNKARAWTRERVVSVQAGLPEVYRILVDIGACAGLRQGEAFGLSVEDLDFEGGFVHVRRQVRSVDGKLVFSLPKGNKTRAVPLADHLADRLRQHLATFPAQPVTLPWKDPRPPTTKLEERERAPQTHRLLVTNQHGRAVRRNMWNANHWKRALWHAGIIEAPEKRPRKTGTGAHLAYGAQPEYGFHCLRHTFASVQLDSRENPVAVSKWLGHADAAITLRIYGHFMPDADGRGRQAIDAWFTSSAESSPDAPQETAEPLSMPVLAPAEEGESAGLGVLDTVSDLGEPAA